MIALTLSRAGNPLDVMIDGRPRICSDESLTSTNGETLPTPIRVPLNLSTAPESMITRTPCGKFIVAPSDRGTPLLANPIW